MRPTPLHPPAFAGPPVSGMLEAIPRPPAREGFMMPERVARIGIGYTPRRPLSREVSSGNRWRKEPAPLPTSGISGEPEANAGAGKRCAGGSPG